MEVTNKRRAAIVGLVVGALLFGGVWFIASTSADDTDPYPVQNGTTFAAADGPQVIIGDDQLSNLTVGDAFERDRVVDLHPYGEFSSTGAVNLTVHGMNTTTPTLSDMDLQSETLTADVNGLQQVDLAGDITDIELSQMAVGDVTQDFDINVSGSGTVTVHGLTNGEVVTAWNAETGNLQDYDTVADGTATFSISENGSTELRETNGPEVDDSSMEPTGQLSEQPNEFSVDVSHPDFPDIAASVEVFVNDESVGSTEVSQNGTATVQDGELPADGGDNDWSVVVTDEYGNSVQSATQTFTLPDELRIYEEGSPNTLIDDTPVDLTFYYQDTDRVFDESTTDGTLDMSGLPVSEDVVIVGRADGYEDRRIYLDSVVEQANIYLLSNQTESVASQFAISDYTGDYPDDETVLKVQRNLNGNWSTVLGDYFGASGQFDAVLASDERYQLILTNTETGDERDLGTITPTTSQGYTIEVTAEDALVITEDFPTISVDPQTRSLTARDDASVSVTVNPMDKEIDEWTATVSIDGTQVYTETETSGGTLTPTFNLTGHEGSSVTVDVTVTAADGTQLSETVTYSVREYFDHDGSLLAVMGSWADELGNATQITAVLLTTILTAALTRKQTSSTEAGGMVALAVLTVFYVTGWVPFGLVFASTVAFAALFAIRRGI